MPSGRPAEPMHLVPFWRVATPTNCETLRGLSGRYSEAMPVLAPATTVEYPLPAQASAEIRSFLAPHCELKVEPQGLATLPGGRVFGPGVVIAPDGRSIARDVSVDFVAPFERHWLMSKRSLRRPRRLDQTVAVVAVQGGETYYHWLLDELPRLLSLGNCAFDSVVLHQTGFNGPALDLFRRTRPAVGLIAAGGSLHLRASRLLVPELPSKSGHPVPRTLDLLQEFVEPLLDGAAAPGERIYISRARARGRRVLNEDALWGRLEQRGFQRIFLEELDWQTQIRLFRQAREIVAPHGAGLANLVFCRPGTRVVELFSRSYMHWCFWQLAALKQLDYLPLVPSGDKALCQMHEQCLVDMELDIEQILASI
jgi:hypothetical protein